MSFALPSLRSTRARPRPVRTTARSPGRTSPLPFRSIVTGTFGTKYGSPMSSLPRLSISTTRRSVSYSDLEEPADRETGTGCPEQQSRADEDQRVEREGDRIHVAPRLERTAVEQGRQRDLLADDEEKHRSQRAGDAAQ